MKYITTYFTSFTVLLLAIASFNWFIDPFGMYWSPVLENINKTKPESGKRSRITKAYQTDNLAPQVLIVGNSRVEMGLDPTSKFFSNKLVYNQGIPGAGVGMQIDYAINTISTNNNIEHIIIGVDYIDFLISEQKIVTDSLHSKKEQSNYSFRLSSHDNVVERAQFLRLKEKLGLIFSLDALSASIVTIAQQSSLTSSISFLGFNNASSYVNIMNTEGIKPLFTQKLLEVKTKLQKHAWKVLTQESFPYSPIFAHLGRLIDAATNKNIKITFFINPYHSSYLHTLTENKHWNNFVLWKTTLVSYLNEKQGVESTLWDFSGFNNMINEAVPLTTPKKQMKWFWEPAHYKKELGERLLARLLNQDNTRLDTIKTDSFGVLVTLGNIDKLSTLNRQHLKDSLSQWQNLQAQLKI
jgi:hypothetical protein